MGPGRRPLLIAALLAAGIAALVALDAGRGAGLDFLLAQRDALVAYCREHRWQALGLYFLVYLASAALSLPFAALLSLASATLFGFGTALLVDSFASSIGALLAMLGARHLLRDAAEARFGRRLAAVNAGLARDGALYLFALRLTPVLPFAAINPLLGLTRMPAWTFYWVSQLGMLPGTAAYIYFGAQLGRIEAGGPLLPPGVLAGLAILGLLPLAAKKLLDALRRRRAAAVDRLHRQAAVEEADAAEKARDAR